ncbi:MAG: HlyC/CorC family transporter [Thiotrichales bacterium]
MHEDHPPVADSRSWLERISKSLLGEPADREQLVELLRSAHRRDLLDLDGLSMIEGVLSVAELKVRDIMIPRAQMDTLREGMGLDEMLRLVVESGHSRFPVIGERKDNVVGILLAKDLLRYQLPGDGARFELSDVMRHAVFIPESKRLNVLLKEFRHSRNHMAIVVDEYGSVAGLVTIEDVLEQIVGEIDDEYDTEESERTILEKSPNHFSVKALTLIEEFNEFFHESFDDSEFDTIGGLVASRFGYMPQRNESVTIGSYTFKVVKADSRRIHLLEVMRSAEPVLLQS